MTQILFPAFLFVQSLLIPQTALADAPQVYFIANSAVSDLPISISTMEALVNFYGMYWNVPTTTLNAVIKCESGFNQYAHNATPPDDSYGLAQINKIHGEHPDISITEAYSPVFAINYLAQGIKNGTDNWSCYKGGNSE